jgi:hypothetical protein
MKTLEAIGLARDTLLGKHELVKQVASMHIPSRLPVEVLEHVHLDLGQVGTLITQSRINPNLESHLRSGVVIVWDVFDKRHHRMKIRELLASAAGSGNLNFGRNALVRHLDLKRT